MFGENTLVISQEEMLRAIKHYHEDLFSGWGKVGNADIVDIKQKGAKPDQPYIITFSPKPIERQR